MIQFPYGIADFRRIRRQGRVYVDRTTHIRDLELLGDVLVFLLFGGLTIGHLRRWALHKSPSTVTT